VLAVKDGEVGVEKLRPLSQVYNTSIYVFISAWACPPSITEID
jgi:hypothetical protein